MCQEKFHNASRKERELLKKIIPLLMKNRPYDYILTPIEGFDKYDGILMYNGKMILLEVKIREKRLTKIIDEHFPQYAVKIIDNLFKDENK